LNVQRRRVPDQVPPEIWLKYVPLTIEPQPV
jgi:hypothetical protein